MPPWTRITEISRLRSKWLTLICERWRDDSNQVLDYWRVEKDDSVIILPVQSGNILCIAPTFRPGVERCTYDFPGGRLEGHLEPAHVVPDILARELQVPAEAIRTTTALNKMKWNVNSSFSNQGLWAFWAEIAPDCVIPASVVGMRVPVDATGVSQLLSHLDCLQCRATLLEWQRATGTS